MARHLDGVDDWITYSPLSVSGPLTIAMWVKPLERAINFLFTIHDSGDTTWAIEILDVYNATGLGPGGWGLFVNHGATETGRIAVDSSVTLGVWNHLAVTWDGSSSYSGMHIYANGVETSYNGITLNGTGSAVPAVGSWLLGLRLDASAARMYTDLAAPAVWNRVLPVAEVKGLASGWHPWTNPRGLVWAPDLDGIGGVDDPFSGRTADLTGTTYVEHPPLFYPGRSNLGVSSCEEIMVPWHLSFGRVA